MLKQSLNLFIHFVNMEEITVKSVWQMVAKFNLPLPDYHIYPNTEDEEEFKLLRKELLGNAREPNESIMEIETKTLELHQTRYIEFADACVDGVPDIKFVNSKFEIFREENLIQYGFKKNMKDVWNPHAVYKTSYQTLEQVIAFRAVLLPFLNNNGNIFSRLRTCRYCGNFFAFDRKDNLYCKLACKNAFHRNK